MIRANIRFSEIDYSATLPCFVSRLVDGGADSQSNQLFYRFIGRLGDRSKGLITKALENIGEQHLEIVLLKTLDRYRGYFLRQLNASLKENELTCDIHVGSFALERDPDTGKYCIALNGVYLDYRDMLRNPAIRVRVEAVMPALEGAIDNGIHSMMSQLANAGSGHDGSVSLASRLSFGKIAQRVMRHADSPLLGLGAQWAHESLDKHCSHILEFDSVKRAILERSETALMEFGIAMRLDDISFTYEGKPAGDQDSQPPVEPHAMDVLSPGFLPLETRRAVINAFADALQSLLAPLPPRLE